MFCGDKMRFFDLASQVQIRWLVICELHVLPTTLWRRKMRFLVNTWWAVEAKPECFPSESQNSASSGCWRGFMGIGNEAFISESLDWGMMGKYQDGRKYLLGEIPDYSGYGFGQWEKALLCNAFSYWPNPYLGMGSANERRRYYVTPSLIGWTHTQNDP